MASNKLELSVLVGAESKQWLSDLTRVVERLEKVAQIASGSLNEEVSQPDVGEDDTEETTTISAASLKKGKDKKGKTEKKVAAAPEEDEDFDLSANDSDEAEEPAVTKKDLIAACRENREAAIKVLKKLKVNSIHDLKPAQYSKVLAEIGA